MNESTSRSEAKLQKISAALGLVVLVGICGPANASPKHRTIPSSMSHADSACVLPDGSSPQDAPFLHCYTPSQFLQAYGIDKVHAAGFTGKGQIIILVDSYGSPTLQADLDHFSDTFNLPKTTVQFIYPNGTYTNPLKTADEVDWAQETTLDVQWAHAVAPDATIVNVVTDNDETVGTSGLHDLFNGIQSAISQYPNAIVSMSFGTGEGTFSASDVKSFVQGSAHQIFQNATNAGFTLLASAGDSGSAAVNSKGTAFETSPDASYPATDPLVTAVGGTAIESGWLWTPEGTADQYWTCMLNKTNPCPTDFTKYTTSPGVVESVWKEDWNVAAGGGGISTIFSAPDFQFGLTSSVLSQVNGFRAIPDVSMNAAINGGVEVYMGFTAPKPNATTPTWQVFGGTSCASPELAGLVALAGEQASQALGRSVGVGSLNNALYKLPDADFNDIVPQTFGDITIDSNQLYYNKALQKVLGADKVPASAITGYPTTVGYDMATGLGSPKALSFVQDVAATAVVHEWLRR